jgi:hypothetical protein
VFYGIAITTSVVLALQIVLLLFGFDGDGDADVDAHLDADLADHATGLHVLSMRSVTAFFTGFGWAGVASLEAGMSLAAAVVVALVVGGALMMAMVALMRGLSGMRYSGTLDYHNAVGAVGNVYLPIPAAMEGPGQVEVLVQGRLCVVRAFTRAAWKIPNRARVRVVQMLDPQTLLVEPLDPPPATPDKES